MYDNDSDNIPFITNQLDEFCEIHSLEYDPTDTLEDIGGNVIWRTAGSQLRGVLEGHRADEVSNWVYLNMK